MSACRECGGSGGAFYRGEYVPCPYCLFPWPVFFVVVVAAATIVCSFIWMVCK